AAEAFLRALSFTFAVNSEVSPGYSSTNSIAEDNTYIHKDYELPSDNSVPVINQPEIEAPLRFLESCSAPETETPCSTGVDGSLICKESGAFNVSLPADDIERSSGGQAGKQLITGNPGTLNPVEALSSSSELSSEMETNDNPDEDDDDDARQSGQQGSRRQRGETRGLQANVEQPTDEEEIEKGAVEKNKEIDDDDD
ncbi:hypothetical protein LTR72_012046, partial [Exophiala xenobiotica]